MVWRMWPVSAERIAYCERARPLKSSGRRADGSIPMSRNGEPVYSCFFQQSSFANFAVAPAKDVVRSAPTRRSKCWVRLAVACRPVPARC